MTLWRHIAPRWLVLAGITLAALLLRLWGLAWGPDQAGALHPGDWTWQVIDSLSWSQPTYHGLWTQTFYSLAALLKGCYALAAGLLNLLLGEVRTVAEQQVSARLAGRVTVALMGVAQVPLVYLVGRRFFDSVATGLLAAALVALSPLMATQAHYLTLDVPLGFMVLCCFWLSWLVMDRPGVWVMLASGLVLGLTITTRASGILVTPVVVLAYWLGTRRLRPAPSRSVFAWPLAWFAGLALGLVLGYPGFVLDPDLSRQVVATSIGLPPGGAPSWGALLAGRLREAAGVLQDLGSPSLGLLWLIGLVLLLVRRRPHRLLLALFPPLYLAVGLGLMVGSFEGVLAVCLPVAALLASWPVVVLCRRLPTYGWSVTGVVVLGLVLCLLPVWRSLRCDYFFWQQDTLSSLRDWVQDHLSPGEQILAGPGTPLDLTLATRPLETRQGWDKLMAGGGFVLLSQAGKGRRDSTVPDGIDLALIPSRLQLVKRFDLKSSPLLPPPRREPPPRWVSPRLELFATLPKLKLRQPLALRRPLVGLTRRFALVYGDLDTYSRGEGGMWLGAGGMAQRVLRMGRRLDRVGLMLCNQGQDLAVAEVRQGPWPSRRVSLYPGQQVDLLLPTRNWPPMVSGFYPLRVSLRRGDHLLAWMVWDPLLLGRRALEEGRYEQAARMLAEARRNGEGGFDSLAMLAFAQVQRRRFGKAGQLLRLLEGPGGEPARSYRRLALELEEGPEWDRRFRELTGYHPGLLRRACSRGYDLKGALYQSRGEEVTIKGRGFHGVYRHGRPDRPGRIRVWLDNPFPRTVLRAELHWRWQGGRPAGGELGRLEVWGSGALGSRRLALQGIKPGVFSRGEGVMTFTLAPARAGSRLEFRAELAPGVRLELERLVVGVDLKAHLRHMLRWYLFAKGSLASHSGRFADAAAAYGELLRLDPGYRPAYLPLAKALLDTGKVDEAYMRANLAEELFRDQPDRLARLRELYQAMQKKKEAARVEKRLAFLKPSLKRQARFAGGLTLLGYDLPQAKVKAGRKLPVSWYWRCWQTPPLDYYIFVHLRGPEQTLNYDHLLDHGRRSMTRLVKGQVVREDYQLAIPKDAPPGRYRLVVGLWDPRFTGKAVPVLEGQGKGSEEVFLAEVEVQAP